MGANQGLALGGAGEESLTVFKGQCQLSRSSIMFIVGNILEVGIQVTVHAECLSSF